MPNSPQQLSPTRCSAPAKSYPCLPPTPLIGLRRSGAGRIWLKHEGYSAGGSFFDRVAHHLLAETRATELGVVGADAFAYSLSIRAASEGRRLSVFDVRPNERRLRSLLRGAGARVKAFNTEDEMTSGVRAYAGELVARNASSALQAALRDLVLEVAASLDGRDVHWVVPDFGQSPERVAESLRVPLSRLSTVADDGERRRELSRSACARRQQVAQREGVLLSPIGAELVERAVGVVDDCDAAVVVLVPECGRRFVGWW